jgi:hypothetical protein
VIKNEPVLENLCYARLQKKLPLAGIAAGKGFLRLIIVWQKTAISLSDTMGPDKIRTQFQTLKIFER